MYSFGGWLALLLAASPAAAVSVPTVVPAAMRVEHLQSGLTVVLVPFASPGVVSYFTLVRAGSRDAVEPGKSGYAHLFEHLMFRGTASVSAHDYEQQMQALGADNNAFTTPDYTLYTPTVSSASVPALVHLDADRFQHLSYSPAAYKDETGAVLGEYRKTAADPGFALEEALESLAFAKHTYGHTTLGLERDVEAMPSAYPYSLSFFRRFYTPDDCTVFVVGDFDADKVMAAVQHEYRGWSGKRAETHALPEPEQTAPRQRALTWHGPTSPRLGEAFHVPSAAANLRDTAALAVAGELLFGDASDLYKRLVIDEQKLTDLRFDRSGALHRDPGLMGVDAKLKPGVPFEEVIAAVDHALDTVGRGDTLPERVDAVRRHLLRDMVLGLETPQSMAGALARWTAVTGDPRSLQGFADALAAVSPDDVARVARTYLSPPKRNVVTLVAETRPASAPAAPTRGHR